MEERARKAEEKERERERKKAEKEQREKEKAEKRGRAKNTGGSTSKPSLRSKSCQKDQQPTMDDVIEPNRCCVCYEDYVQEEDMEWVQCPCSRWLHEDCIIDTLVDSSGKEWLCPSCV